MSKHGRLLSTHEALANQVYSKYKSEARIRGRDFSLSREYLIELISQVCHYCQAPPGNTIRRRFYGDHVLFYSGIDRKDNQLGYTPENVVPCCIRCNKVKREVLSYAEMLAVGRALKRMKKRP